MEVTFGSRKIILLYQWLYIIHSSTEVKGHVSFYTTMSSTKCFSVPGVPRLDFHKCQSDEMILIQEAFHGISTDRNNCFYSRSDCIERTSADTDSQLNNQCIGLPSCSITVSVAWMTNCNAYSKYNHVIYQCIPEVDVLDICQSQVVRVSRLGFIRSSGYPNSYDNNLECQCNVTTHLTQKILLTFADCDTEWSEGCQRDVIQIVDGESVMPRCGKLPRSYNITSTTNQVQVYFKTDDWIQHKGFWLSLEALGSMDIACGPASNSPITTVSVPTTTSLMPSTTTEPGPELTESQLDDFINVSTGEDYEDTNDITSILLTFPPMLPDWSDTNEREAPENDNGTRKEVSSLVAIIIGILALSLVVIIIVFLLLWFKKRHHKEQISQVDQVLQLPTLHRLNRGGRDLPASPYLPARGSPCSTLAKEGTQDAHAGHTESNTERGVDVNETKRKGLFTSKKSIKAKLKGKFKH